jgi:hypothetical protein
VLACDFAEQHHADEKKVDVRAFGDCARGERERHKVKNKQQQDAGGNPIDLGNLARADEHQRDARENDESQQQVAERHFEQTAPSRVAGFELKRNRARKPLPCSPERSVRAT